MGPTVGVKVEVPGPRDDAVLPFSTIRSRMAGRVVRLGATVDAILSAHDYPLPVSEALGEALALTALLGQPLQEGGRLILQTRSDGPLGFLVVQYEAPGRLRGYASHDGDRLAALAAAGPVSQGALVGEGRLAMTIDPGGEQVSYQGIVALEGQGLTETALAYFRQSEQLPTFIRLAVAREMIARKGQQPARWRWRAGGLIVQQVPAAGSSSPEGRTGEVRDGSRDGESDEDWNRVRMLASTIEAHELIDPSLASERLLIRLFHEEGVRVSPVLGIEARCRCSRERIGGFLAGFSATELADLREADGGIVVRCEFCATSYRFEIAGTP